MTREEMREKVARALAETQGEIVNDAWRFYLDDADAAIGIIRGETLEEAEARVKETLDEHGDPLATDRALIAIRTLKNKDQRRAALEALIEKDGELL